jgi:hypothetical protein
MEALHQLESEPITDPFVRKVVKDTQAARVAADASREKRALGD